MLYIFFFRQNTAYELRISDWSSYVCSSDLSLAAAKQGKFKAFHDKLFAAGRPTPSAIAAARQATGVTPVPDSAEFRAEVEKNYELARSINASGTPTFVVGDQVLQGAVGYEALKEAIARARDRKSTRLNYRHQCE